MSGDVLINGSAVLDAHHTDVAYVATPYEGSTYERTSRDYNHGS
jgi:hypothetical protein